MSIEETKLTCELRSVRELNLYLLSGWRLLLTYVKQLSDTQEPRFIVGWHTDDEPVVPEMLDEWELNEIDRQRYR
ncbi:MAG TPA: hypothetical protein VHL50_06820 [Pyrinomonadaceae bacterium]|jgi:hypothetical protein|nr:hypothetical protein [Pyrinomonadaceae bacterium]